MFFQIVDFGMDGPLEAFGIAGPIPTDEEWNENNGEMGYDVGIFEADSEKEALDLAYGKTHQDLIDKGAVISILPNGTIIYDFPSK